MPLEPIAGETKHPPGIILASGSPRRHSILNQIGISHSVVPSLLDETIQKNIPLYSEPEYLAKQKAKDVSSYHPEALVLGFDTLVYFESQPLGKPHTDEDARKMLQRLSGHSHLVISGVAIARNGKILSSDSEKTKVFFRNLAAREMESYISGGEHKDKAGSYGIQGEGARFVSRIEGCYYNVVGLPVSKMIDLLKQIGEIF